MRRSEKHKHEYDGLPPYKSDKHEYTAEYQRDSEGAGHQQSQPITVFLAAVFRFPVVHYFVRQFGILFGQASQFSDIVGRICQLAGLDLVPGAFIPGFPITFGGWSLLAQPSSLL